MFKIYDTSKILGSKLISLSNFLLNQININLSNEFKKAMKVKKKIFIPHVVSQEICGKLDAYKDWLENKITDELTLNNILLKIDKWIQYFQSSEILLDSNFWNGENKFILKLIYEDSFNKTEILLKSQDKDKKLPNHLFIIKDAIILKELQSIPDDQKGGYIFISTNNYFRKKMKGINIKHFYFSKGDNDFPFKYIKPSAAESLNKKMCKILKEYYQSRKYRQQIEIDNDWNYIDFITAETKVIKGLFINVRVWHGEPDDCFGFSGVSSRMHERLFVKIIYENDNWKIHYINNEYGRNYYSADI